MITDQLVIVRGDGKLDTGIVQALRRAGFPALVLEQEPAPEERAFCVPPPLCGIPLGASEDTVIPLAHSLDEAQYQLFEGGLARLSDPEGAAIRGIIDTEEKYSAWDTGLTTLEGGGRHLFLLAVVDARGASAETPADLAPVVLNLKDLNLAPDQAQAVAGHAVVTELVGFAARKAVDETD